MTAPRAVGGVAPGLAHRAGTALVRVRSADGTPLASREVVVSQRTHAFRFGCTAFEAVELADDRQHGEARERAERVMDRWLDLFNTATLPFYWGRFEPARGVPDSERLLAAARWLVERGVMVKGHPLAWHTLTPNWLLALPVDEIARVLIARIERDVAAFAGLIDTWDVVNEAVIMPIFTKEDNGITRLCRARGRIALIRQAFEAARAANPRAVLLLNDFDVSAAYECLIEGCLEAGIRIDALGIQSHMHQGWWGVEKTLRVVERFARYGLPIHFSENTLVSGQLMAPQIVDLNDYRVDEWPSTPDGEERQAAEVVEHYRTLVAHPAIGAITWWGLPDGGWLNAPSGLVRADGTPKAAYVALHGLLKGDWWLTPTRTVADEEGRLEFTGFLGEYEVAAAAGRATIRLEHPGTVELDVRLRDGRASGGWEVA